ncbi:MAG: hypothetical protein NTX72_04670 [Candidatus Uhrbacteria bacterium]|nr:hypothetical protein [Candidatus Uhrbacteria bacterium]
MSKIVLLHGFAVHLTAPIVRPAFGPSASMSAFDELVSTGEARVFPWGIAKRVKPWQLLNPLLIQQLYQDEYKLIQSLELQRTLQLFLEREKPSMIVCHSMGCSLLQNYLEKFTLPSSIKSIVLVQSDLAATKKLRTNVTLHHLYCPWDPTLLLSSLVSNHLRAGLCKSKQAGVNNILFPLTTFPNLHTSSICDKKLPEFVTRHL